MYQYNIFYSWQSDLPNNTNRSFIEQALVAASKAIRDDETIKVDPVIDRDTMGIPGAPNIAETILKKIEQAHVFVCDVSIINAKTRQRKTPNPNVLFELGYASGKLGSEHLILVFNTAYGKIETLPFDLKMIRTIAYNTHEADSDKSTERRGLQKRLENAIVSIISGKSRHKYISIDFFTMDEDAVFRVIQPLSAIVHFDKQRMESLIKRVTSLYSGQAKLLIDYLIDFDYITPFTSSGIYILGKAGRALYYEQTAKLEKEQARIQRETTAYNNLLNMPPTESQSE